MTEAVISSGRRFACNAGENILDAALRQGVVLEYSCRTGRCGTCRARLTSGSTTAEHVEIGLSAEEQAAGWILTCVRTADSDVSLDVEDLTGIVVHPVRTLPCRVSSVEHLAADVVRVVLRLPPNAPLTYRAGQYVDVIAQGGLRRSYSIANAFAAKGEIELHIRQVSEGRLSAYWFGSAKVNDLLRLRGPLGTCFLRNVAGSDLVFLATGTGIAPIKAMLEELGSAEPAAAPRSVSLYWGGRVRQDLYWDPHDVGFDGLFVPVLSRAGVDWNGARGHVQDVLLANRPDLSRALIYACGSDAMIRAARQRLVDAGLVERSFRSDAFVTSGGES